MRVFENIGDRSADDLISALFRLNELPSRLDVSKKASALVRQLSVSPRNGEIQFWRADEKIFSSSELNLLTEFVWQKSRPNIFISTKESRRATDLFWARGEVSSVALFCACLPEVYAYPSISRALAYSGALESQAAYRIKATAGMIYPVMLPGGITSKDGRGIFPVIRSRLIHSCVRCLLKYNPPDTDFETGVPLDALVSDSELPFFKICGAGRGVGGIVPINQLEMVYVLLCFTHVFLDALRKMGVRVSKYDQEAYISHWAVIGEMCGICNELIDRFSDCGDGLLAEIKLLNSGVSVDEERFSQRLVYALLQVMEGAIVNRRLRRVPYIAAFKLCSSDSRRIIGLSDSLTFGDRVLLLTMQLAMFVFPDFAGKFFKDVGGGLVENVLGMSVANVHGEMNACKTYG